MRLHPALRRRPRGDEGAILILVLLFILVIGLAAATVTTETTASLSNTNVVRNKTAKVYTADSGVEAAIQRLREDPTLCPMVGGGPRLISGLDAAAIPGPGAPEPATPALSVTCETLSGSSTGALGFGIVTTDTSSTDSFTTSGSTAPVVDGPVYAGDWVSNVSLTLRTGDAYESPNDNRCTGPGSQPSRLTLTPPFVYRCANPAGYASPLLLAQAVPHDLPPWSGMTDRAIGPMSTPLSGCSVFQPGRYISPSVVTLPLTRDNYFASGDYYFENVVINVDASTIVGGRISVVGGTPGPDDTVQNLTGGAGSGTAPTTPCSSDTIAGVTDGSTGITWILGGGSRIVLGGGNSQMELFTRSSSTSGTDGMTIIAVPTSVSGQWQQSNVVYTTNTCNSGSNITGCLLYQAAGSSPQLSMQGLIWAPQAHLQLNNTTNTQGARFSGGIVSGRLALQNSASASGFAISVRNKPSRRVVRIVSQAGGGSDGRVVQASAVVQIGNDAVTTTALQSWRSD